MIQNTNTKEDLEITINAYYNFIGHNCLFNNVQVDSLLKKAIDIEES
jgi:hypothetical protein